MLNWIEHGIVVLQMRYVRPSTLTLLAVAALRSGTVFTHLDVKNKTKLHLLV